MDLKVRFVAADISDVVKVNELEVGRKYPISKARRLDTKYGDSVLLTILEFGENPVSVFLPKRYTGVFTDDDIDRINSKRTKLHLIYKGTCEKIRAYKLEIE